MIQNITGVVFIIFHIICCVLVWTGINSHLLKVKRYLILPVIFVPVWGMICVLLLHFQIFFHQDKKREIGIEKMKINEEIYRSIIAPKEESDRNIVPLEEVLLIDEAAMRRDLLMNVLNDDPENYIDMLKQARMNDDVEVVHYAITGMVELSKEYESRLQNTSFSINAGMLNLSATVYTRRKIKDPSTMPTALTKIPPLPRIVPPISREASAMVTIPCPILISTDFCD